MSIKSMYAPLHPSSLVYALSMYPMLGILYSHTGFLVYELLNYEIFPWAMCV